METITVSMTASQIPVQSFFVALISYCLIKARVCNVIIERISNTPMLKLETQFDKSEK